MHTETCSQFIVQSFGKVGVKLEGRPESSTASD
jgi:hypothetical protein